MTASPSPALPPWAVHPDMPRRSIGWRMGGGQGVAIAFAKAYAALTPEERDACERANPGPAE